MSSPSKRREMDLMKLMMSDYKVEMINDGMQEFYVEFHGPKDICFLNPKYHYSRNLFEDNSLKRAVHEVYDHLFPDCPGKDTFGSEIVKFRDAVGMFGCHLAVKSRNAMILCPYLGGVWRIRVELPDAYPYKSPSIGFVNKIYHPNVDEMSGSVCLDVINQTWSPMFDLVNVFEVFLPQLLLYPNPSDPLNGEAAALMMRDRNAYEQRVKEYCEKFAKPEDAGAAPEEKSSDEELSEDDYDSSDEAVAGRADP